MTRLTLLGSLVAAACSQAGCVFFQKELVPGLDPEAASFAYVTGTHGKTLTLRGGGSVTLDALSLEGMSEYQRQRLTYTLKQWTDPDRGSGGARRGLLIRDFAGPIEVLLSVPYRPLRMICGLRPISLLPIRVEVPPTRVDLVEYVLKTGMARLDQAAVADPARRGQYLKAQDAARTNTFGVWAPPGEQLLEAVEFGNVKEVARLIKAGVDVEYVGRRFPPRTAPQPDFALARSLGWPRTYRYTGQTPLRLAVERWHFEIVRILLRHGANPNRGALGSAAHAYIQGSGKRLKMLTILVAGGADVAAADAKARLIDAGMFSRGDWAVIDYLRSRGAVIAANTLHGPRLLADAAAVGDVSSVTRLIAFGADPNRLTQLGVYPLNIAARTGRLKIATLLLDAGADPSRKDTQGRTPLDRAKSGKANAKMIALLKSRGAK